jgi:O-antigen ligase
MGRGLLNFGMLGVIAMMGILGYAIRRGDLAIQQSLQTGGVALVLGAVLPFYMVIILRGSLLQTVDNVVVLAMAIWWISEPRRRTKPTESVMTRRQMSGRFLS